MDDIARMYEVPAGALQPGASVSAAPQIDPAPALAYLDDIALRTLGAADLARLLCGEMQEDEADEARRRVMEAYRAAENTQDGKD